MPSQRLLLTLLAVVLTVTNNEVTLAQTPPENLCHVPGCSCNPNSALPDLIDVHCRCPEEQEINLGIPSMSPGSSLPPNETVEIKMSGCKRVEFNSRILNWLPRIQNISIEGTEKLVLKSRMYEPRMGDGKSVHIKNFEIANVRELDIARQTFEGLSVDGVFWLKETFIPKVPSLAFNFDHVNEISIFGSRLDRVSMWGFKFNSCGDFNVLGMSRFFSLASQAINIKCNKFMLAYNVFVNVHDSSFNVKFGFSDIQGNTFESITGMPFVNLKPIGGEDVSNLIDDEVQVSPGGLVFRENKFSATSAFPFGALALPAFNSLDKSVTHVQVDTNHFLCDCPKIDWFIGAAILDYDREGLENVGAYHFVKEVYRTAGNCLKCSLTSCEVTNKSFHDFAEKSISVKDGALKCSDPNEVATTRPPKSSYDYERENEIASNGKDDDSPRIPEPSADEEGGARGVKNMDFSSASELTCSQTIIIVLSGILLMNLALTDRL